jgi:hypothetical protein
VRTSRGSGSSPDIDRKPRATRRSSGQFFGLFFRGKARDPARAVHNFEEVLADRLHYIREDHFVDQIHIRAELRSAQLQDRVSLSVG